MESKRDLVAEYRLAANEYLQWLETGADRFGEVPGLGDVLVRMYHEGNLYGWLAQKGLYEYRVKFDPEIWRELQRRHEADGKAIAAAVAQAQLTAAEREELDRILGRMEMYYDNLAQAAEDWFYKEELRKQRKSGCGLFAAGLFLMPLAGLLVLVNIFV